MRASDAGGLGYSDHVFPKADVFAFDDDENFPLSWTFPFFVVRHTLLRKR
jgi:hypothetical protein